VNGASGLPPLEVWLFGLRVLAARVRACSCARARGASDKDSESIYAVDLVLPKKQQRPGARALLMATVVCAYAVGVAQVAGIAT
jgi:hypothetical protein